MLRTQKGFEINLRVLCTNNHSFKRKIVYVERFIKLNSSLIYFSSKIDYLYSVFNKNIESYLIAIGERVSFHDNVVVIICSFFTIFDG